MDDGIELNFAAPPSGAAAGYTGGKKKGGRWTDRVKQNRNLKRRAEGGQGSEQQAPRGERAAGQAGQAPGARKGGGGASGAPAARAAGAAGAGAGARSGGGGETGGSGDAAPASGRPAGTSMTQGRPAPSAPANGHASSGSSGAQRKTAPSSTNPTPRASAVISTKGGNAHAGPSQPRPASSGTGKQPAGAATGTGTGTGLQIVSSLFTSDPRARRDDHEEGAAGEDDDATLDADAEAHAAAPSNAPLDTSTFSGLGLDPLLERHLRDKMGISRPTVIQRATLGALLDPTPLTRGVGAAPTDPALPTTIRDAFIQSQTGSGKTLAYLLPILQSLIPLATALQDAGGGYIDRSIGTLAIVLVPTRELARQISEVVDRVLALSLAAHDLPGAPANGTPPYRRYLVSGLLTGGQTMTHEKSRLRKGCPILIATPGRLLDHLQNTQSFRVDRLMWLVLDEADRLMESGFGEVLEGIVKALEGRRRIGIEAAVRNAARAERQSAPSKTVSSHGRSGGFGNAWDDGEDDEDDESGGEDYETRGAIPAGKSAVKVEAEEGPTASAPSTATTDPSWPYWSLGRRTILCSATVGQDVKALAGVALKDPVWFRGTADEAADAAAEPNGDELIKPAVDTAGAPPKTKAEHEETFTPPSQLAQRYTVVPPKLRLVTLVALLRSLINKDKKARAANPAAVAQGTKIIVFMSCTDSVDFHWQMLGGISMAAQNGEGEGTKAKDDPEAIARSTPLLPSTSIYHLHGSLPLVTRQKSLRVFSAASPSPSILLCTSVASRGLDLPLVRAVVQYDLPTEHGVAEYVHRVGRTARVGAGGESWAFVGAGGEEGWVDWVTKGMSARESKEAVTLHPVRVEQVLRAGFGGKGAEYEARATQVQLAMERWVLEDEQNTNLSRAAFQSSIRAYSTHPSEEKRFFNVKSLHLGHVAKSFGLREAPGKIAAGAALAAKGAAQGSAQEKLGASRDPRKRKREAGDSDDEDDIPEDTHTSASARRQPRNAVEARMYEAVRKQGRLSKMGGKMGEGQGRSADGKKRPSQNSGNSGIASEFQVVQGQSEMDRLISKSSRR